MSEEAPVAAPKARVRWVDAGKGVAIFLVVFLHSFGYFEGAQRDTTFWQEVNEILRTLRMPLFFALSGIFAARWARRNWSEVWGRKVALLVWVYLVWALLWTGFQVVLLVGRSGGIASTAPLDVMALFGEILWGHTVIWFLYALAVYFVVIRVISGLPWWLQLAGASALSVVATAGVFADTSKLLSEMSQFFVFFLVGVLASERILRLRVKGAGWVVGLTLYAIAWTLVANHLRDAGTLQLPFVTFTMSLFALPLGFVLGLATSSLGFLRYLGRNTLPVYVLHRFILAVLAPVLLKLGAPTDMLGELVMPPTLAVVTIVVALSVFWLTQRVGLRGLFELPTRGARSTPATAVSPV